MAVGLLLVGGVGFYLFVVGPNQSVADLSSRRTFVDAENLKSFEKNIEIGETMPVASPFSGKHVGYPAELCYWTAAGKTKDEPTAVLLNSWVGKPNPTFCPECGRLVVPHNPRPRP